SGPRRSCRESWRSSSVRSLGACTGQPQATASVVSASVLGDGLTAKDGMYDAPGEGPARVRGPTGFRGHVVVAEFPCRGRVDQRQVGVESDPDSAFAGPEPVTTRRHLGIDARDVLPGELFTCDGVDQGRKGGIDAGEAEVNVPDAAAPFLLQRRW